MRLPDFRAIVKFSAFGVAELDIPKRFHETRGRPFIDRLREPPPPESAPAGAPAAQDIRIS